jgi:DNA polymerase-3 subunit epsilon
MGRCLSPCLGDLDPNLYRRRLDEVLRLFVDEPERQPLLEHVRRQMRAAAAAQRFERAEALRRRARRLAIVLERLGGVLEATHARPRLILASHPVGPGLEGFWLVGGRLADWGPVNGDPGDLQARTERALAKEGRAGELGAHVPPGEIDEVRIIGSWLASHPDTAQLGLRPAPDGATLAAFLREALLGEGELDDERGDPVGAQSHA